MTINNVKKTMATFKEALSKLKESLELLEANKNKSELNEICTDAVVKRFEVCFEYCWKVMKTAADYQGAEAFGPRPAIQEAIKFGWIDDPEFWANALDARNGSVHDYFGITMDQYISLVKQFAKKADEFAGALKEALKIEL
ncbi:MAG: HI0074 family nucleotidyltransferase substrate-binding subunit [Pseudomonadota bacterium]